MTAEAVAALPAAVSSYRQTKCTCQGRCKAANIPGAVILLFCAVSRHTDETWGWGRKFLTCEWRCRPPQHTHPPCLSSVPLDKQSPLGPRKGSSMPFNAAIWGVQSSSRVPGHYIAVSVRAGGARRPRVRVLSGNDCIKLSAQQQSTQRDITLLYTEALSPRQGREDSLGRGTDVKISTQSEQDAEKPVTAALQR